ncbi:uncharacterized protein LOC134270184 [Saccostrea cucullata]|uniref:uncharacterized protein LOC134270184 n=1 Tax=Saccostrea cuccullata TaxID=36930 RepID=UPI002ED1CBAE
MNHVPRLSEAVYFGLSKLIGTPTQLRIRREVKGIEQETRLGLYTKGVYPMYGMLTGSRGEGFRASFADQDVMFWPHNHNVICELSQISRYCIPQDTVILMECEDLKPGFTKLNLLSPTQFSAVGSSCIVISNKVYISTLIRDLIVLAVNMGSNSPHWFLHGPCCSNVLRLGDLSVYMDFAFSFHSHHWPTISLPWIQRCRTQGWPSEDVVSDILNGGFHVVPIGSTPENELEWRISFSQAELKLVFAMNHSYGDLPYFIC